MHGRPPLTPDDYDLVAALQSGSQEGFSELVRRMHTNVRAYLFSFIGDRSVVDDLAQETFLAAYRDRQTFEGRSALSTWVFGIARNRALSHLRNKLRNDARDTRAFELARIEKLATVLADDASPLFAEVHELAALRGCIGKLTPHSGRLVNEHYFGRRPLAQIARESGRKESTIRVELLRVRSWLRRCVEKSLAEVAPE